MDPQLDRRRYPNVRRPNGGERCTDKAARASEDDLTGPRLWWRGAILWIAAAAAGTAFGATWLQG